MLYNFIMKVIYSLLILFVLQSTTKVFSLAPSQFQKSSMLLEKVARVSDFNMLMNALDRVLENLKLKPYNEEIVSNEIFLETLNLAIIKAESNDFIFPLKKSPKQVYDKVTEMIQLIMNSSSLSELLWQSIKVTDESLDQGVKHRDVIEFASETQKKFLKDNFSSILHILQDPNKSKKLLTLLSLLRIAYYKASMPDELNQTSSLTSFEYAIQNKIYISLGNGLYITPLSDSFRRHIIFQMDPDQLVHYAIEIFIPGEYEAAGAIMHRTMPGRQRYDISKWFQDQYGDQVGSIPVLAVVEHDSIGTIDAYGEKINFDPMGRLRMFLYDYSNRYRGRRLANAYDDPTITKMYLDRYDKQPTVRSMMRDMLQMILIWFNEGYIFLDSNGTHIRNENFRLGLDGKVYFVGDYDFFGKSIRTDRSNTLINIKVGTYKNIILHAFELLGYSIIELDAIYDEIFEEVLNNPVLPLVPIIKKKDLQNSA